MAEDYHCKKIHWKTKKNYQEVVLDIKYLITHESLSVQ